MVYTLVLEYLVVSGGIELPGEVWPSDGVVVDCTLVVQCVLDEERLS